MAYQIHQTLPQPYCAKVAGIYAIVNRNNHKVYIGSAVQLNRRWTLHRHDCWRGRQNPYFMRAFRKEPDAFYLEVIEELPGATKEKRLAREQFWMDFYRSYVRANGYNLCPKARSCEGVKHEPEYGKAISKRQKGKTWTDEHKAQVRAVRVIPRGWKWTMGQRARNSAAHKGKNWTEKQTVARRLSKHIPRGRSVVQLTLAGEFVAFHKSMSDAERLLGNKPGKSNIGFVCKGRRHHALGFKWKYG